MKNVNRVVGRDGRVRLYLRKRGLPSVPLQNPWGSPELEKEVAGLLAALSDTRPLPGTLKGAAREYELGADFRGLAESTKYEYRLILKELEADFGLVPVAGFTPAYVLGLRDLWAERGHRAANVRMQILKNVLKRSLIQGLLEKDPFAVIDQVRRPDGLDEPHEVWTDTDFLEVMNAAKPGLARGVAVGRYVGARRGDIVRVAEGARKEGRFSYLSGKRKVPVDVPEPPELTYWLDRLPRASRSLTIAYNEEGLPYSDDGFALVLRKLVAKLAKAGKVNPRLDVHGLRHTRGVEYALAGLTDAEGAAALGHRSPHSFAPYRRQADRIRLSDNGAAKLAKLHERAGNGPVQNTVQNSCKTPGKIGGAE